MVAGAFPEVLVWAKSGSSYALVGNISIYDSLSYEQRYLDPGDWEMTLPYNALSQGITADRLYTIDWRGKRTTWCLDKFNPSSSAEGGVTLNVGGTSGLSLLGRELAWPDPTLAIGSQPVTSPLTSGPAETVIRSLVSSNFVTRRGETLTMGTNGGRGTDVRARPKFHNLLELVSRLARRGGITVDVGLVNTSSTRANLTFLVGVPADLTSRVYLSEKVGNLAGWSQTNDAPTATRAIVTGADSGSSRLLAQVTTTAGDAAAALWGGHRVSYVQGPSSYDAADLTQAGTEALDEGAAVTHVAFEPTDTDGLMAFRDYNVGDKVTGQLTTGLNVQDVISSIRVEVGDGYPEITPTFGKPDTDEPMVSMADLVRSLNRRIRLMEQRS